MKYVYTILLSVILFSCGTQKKTTVSNVPPPPPPQVDKPVAMTPARVVIHHDAPGRTAKIGDIMLVHVANYNAHDSLMYTTFGGMDPVPLEVTAPEFKGDLMDAVMMASEGDSLSVLIPVDSLKEFDPVPGVVERGEDIKLVIKVIKLMTKDEYKAYQEKETKDQAVKDEKIIEEYLKKNRIKATRTASGLYYVIDKKGAGPTPTKGSTVKVHYTGTFLDGKKFDSSRDHGEPLEFPLGQSRVIAGWDEGIGLLNKGAKARLFIPSALAYGPNGFGSDIPPNAVLIFEVELVDFK